MKFNNVAIYISTDNILGRNYSDFVFSTTGKRINPGGLPTKMTGVLVIHFRG